MTTNQASAAPSRAIRNNGSKPLNLNPNEMNLNPTTINERKLYETFGPFPACCSSQPHERFVKSVVPASKTVLQTVLFPRIQRV